MYWYNSFQILSAHRVLENVMLKFLKVRLLFSILRLIAFYVPIRIGIDPRKMRWQWLDRRKSLLFLALAKHSFGRDVGTYGPGEHRPRFLLVFFLAIEGGTLGWRAIDPTCGTQKIIRITHKVNYSLWVLWIYNIHTTSGEYFHYF